MSINPERLQKLLALTASENDSEALLALRRAQSMLAEEGLALDVFAVRHVLAVAKDGPPTADKPSCHPVPDSNPPMLEVRPAAPAERFPLPDLPARNVEQLCQSFSELLAVASSRGMVLRIRLDLSQEGQARVWGDLPGYRPVELWSGVKGDGATVASSLRRAAIHALPHMASN